MTSFLVSDCKTTWEKEKKEIFAFCLLALTLTGKPIYFVAEALLRWY